MFLLFFLIFVLLFTIFQNILIAGIFLLLICIGLVIYQSVSKKKILGKQLFLSLVAGFLLASGVFGIKEWRYYSGNEEYGKMFAGTGTISDISSQGKYIFEVGKRKYLLYSKKQYTIGDVIWLVGNIDSGRNPGRRNDVHSSYRTISSGTFAIPIFSGDFDYGKRLKMKGRKGTIYETNSIRIDVIPDLIGNPYKANWIPAFAGMTGESGDGIGFNPSVGIIQSMKKSIQEKVIAAYGENKASGLILGMLIGDKSQIPETEYQQFIDSGLVHLIAVSGGNILMIVVFLQCILFFLPFYIRIGCILLTIIGYSLICGLDSSVFRAMLMGGLSMVALFRGREINIRRLLSISVIIMLIINPYFLVYDTGFLLSYSALIGIVYFDSIQKRPEKEPKLLKKGRLYIYKSYISPSIGASIGIFPIIIFFMGKINLVSIIGNLLVLPLVPFVMIYGFVSVWLYSLLGWGRMLRIEQFLVNYIYKISELLTTYGLYISVTGLWIKYLIVIGFLVGFVIRRVKSNKNTVEN